jgi:hypothetical protein
MLSRAAADIRTSYWAASSTDLRAGSALLGMHAKQLVGRGVKVSHRLAWSRSWGSIPLLWGGAPRLRQSPGIEIRPGAGGMANAIVTPDARVLASRAWCH